MFNVNQKFFPNILLLYLKSEKFARYCCIVYIHKGFSPIRSVDILVVGVVASSATIIAVVGVGSSPQCWQADSGARPVMK